MPTETQKDKLVCHCLRVTEADLSAAVEHDGARDLEDVMACTGAGEGCTACHPAIQAFLKRRAASRRSPQAPAYSPSFGSPSCSVR